MKGLIGSFLIISILLIPVQARGGEKKQAPKVESHAAILMDFKTGRVLWEKSSTEPKAMASTTKIMTAIMILEKGNLKDEVIASKRAAAAPRVKMNLQAGEKQRLEDLFYALMLESSNDAAVAIAEHLGGTVEDFCEQMTQRAKELGAKDTVFKTPNGLDLDNHHSTAYDLAVITRHALSIPKFVEVINTKQVNTPIGGGNYKPYHFTNKNRLLYEFQGATGVKTGYTGKAGHCFVGAAERDGMQLISVVLASGWGAKGRMQKFEDSKKILNYGFQNFAYEILIQEKQMVRTIPVLHGKEQKVSLCYGGGLELPMKEGEKAGIQVKLQHPEAIEAPIVEGQSIGTAKIYLHGEFIREIPLIARESVERHDFGTSLEKIFKNWLMLPKSSFSIQK